MDNGLVWWLDDRLLWWLDNRLLWWLVGAAVVAISAAIVVVLVKSIHRVYLRWQGVRSAYYLAVIGQLVQRETLPASPPRDWSHDSLFHAALVEYRLHLAGPDRGFVDNLVEYLGVMHVLEKRMRNKLSSTRRLRAVGTFVNLATVSHLDELRRLLLDPSHHVAIHAAKGLSRLGALDSVHAILGRAAMASPWHAARFTDALIGYGPAVGVPVRQWVQENSTTAEPPVRMVALAIQVLGRVRDVDSESFLVGLVVADEPEWRLKAVSALGEIGGYAAVSSLCEALEDPHWPVRARAAVALGHIGDPTSADALRLALNDQNWWVRQNASEAIAQLPGGGPLLVDVLTGDDPFAVDAALYQLAMRGEVSYGIIQTENGSGSDIFGHLEVHVDQADLAPRWVAG